MVKISNYPKHFQEDINILERIQTVLDSKKEKSKLVDNAFPKIVECGKIALSTMKSFRFINDKKCEKDQLCFYIIPQNGFLMSRFVQMNKSNRFQLKHVYIFGSKLLDMLEIIHEAGYVYNNLRFENIHFGLSQYPRFYENNDNFDELTFHIQEFTTATPYKDFSTGKHLPQEKVKGIMTYENEFASLSQL